MKQSAVKISAKKGGIFFAWCMTDVPVIHQGAPEGIYFKAITSPCDNITRAVLHLTIRLFVD